MNLRSILVIASSAILLNVAAAAAGETGPAEYVANIRQHVAFLDLSSRLAADRSSSDKLREYAKAQAEEQGAVTKDLQVWEGGQPTGGLTSPMVVAAGPDGDLPSTSDKLMTGRSAAVDGANDAGVLMPSPGVVIMPRLATLKGESFDDLYEAAQSASLKELQGLYGAYGMTGKDPTLRALAIRELPKIKQRLSELDAL